MDKSFNTIFTFLFVVVIILSQVGGAILKKLKSQNQQRDESTGKAGAGRPGIIQSLMTHIKEELEKAQQAAQTPSGQPTGWEAFTTPSNTAKDIAPDDAFVKQPPYRQTAAVTDDYPKKFSEALSSDNLSIDEDILEDELLLDSVPDDLDPAPSSLPPVVPQTRTSRTVTTHRVRELRRAVIWSEILAPPLALKKEE